MIVLLLVVLLIILLVTLLVPLLIALLVKLLTSLLVERRTFCRLIIVKLVLVPVLIHVTEVPAQGDVYTRVAPILLMTGKGIRRGKVFPLAAVEHIAPVNA